MNGRLAVTLAVTTIALVAHPVAAQDSAARSARPTGCRSGWRFCADSLSESVRARFVWEGYERGLAAYDGRGFGTLFARRDAGRSSRLEADLGIAIPFDQQSNAYRQLLGSVAARYRVRPADWDDNEWWSVDLAAIGGHMANGRVTGMVSATRAERLWNPEQLRGISEYPPVLTLRAAQFFGGLTGSLVRAQLSMTVPQLAELSGWNGLLFVAGSASNMPAQESVGTTAFRGDVAEAGLRIMHETSDVGAGTMSLFLEARAVWSARILAPAVPVIALGATFRR